MHPHGLAWLFDIDGTLIVTDGAARDAIALAVRDCFGVEDGLADLALAGRTDPLILADVLAKLGRVADEEDEARLLDSIFGYMRVVLTPGRGHVLAGVVELLDHIAREPGWVTGLLTGNMSQMAAIKLERFGLWDRFAFGAFGEEAEDRDALACRAIERVGAAYRIPADRCIVVGDTELDIQCARAAGARVIAVATGTRSRDELLLHRPDLLLDNLADMERIGAWARGVEPGSTAQ